MTTTAQQLRVEGLTLDYQVGRDVIHALVGVDLTINAGESVAIIGESGSGKSTLAKAMAGLSPANAYVRAGSIELVDGDLRQSISDLPERDLRKLRWSHVAYVPQSAINAFNPVMRIGDHFLETVREHGRPSRDTQSRSEHLLDAVGLDARRVWLSYPHELSGGMRQRTLIALALLLEPAFLILDEPTTALDVLNQQSIVAMLKALKDRGETSIVFISHDLAVASQVADRIVTLYAGRVVEHGPSEALTPSRCRHPYTRGLFHAIPTLSGPPAVSIPGTPPDLRLNLPGCPFAPRCQRASDLCTEVFPPRSTSSTQFHCHHPYEQDQVT